MVSSLLALQLPGTDEEAPSRTVHHLTLVNMLIQKEIVVGPL